MQLLARLDEVLADFAKGDEASLAMQAPSPPSALLLKGREALAKAAETLKSPVPRTARAQGGQVQEQAPEADQGADPPPAADDADEAVVEEAAGPVALPKKRLVKPTGGPPAKRPVGRPRATPAVE